MKNIIYSLSFGKVISFIILILMATKISAQQQITHYIASGKDRLKTISGQYGDLSGICLFEDGKFMLYGYATMVFGSYGFEKDYLLFYPDQLPRFQLYANHNPTLGDSTRINFRGFEEGKTFVQFGNDSIQHIFNENANRFDSQNSYQQFKRIPSFEFTVQPEYFEIDTAYHTFQYRNDQNFNDFIAFYNKPQRARENFSGSLYLIDGNKLAIRLSNYGGQKGFLRESQVDSTEKRWLETLTMKREYDRIESIEPPTLFVNAVYNIFYPDLEDYIFNKTENSYMSKSAQDNEGYFSDNPYQDDRYLRQYTKQPLTSKSDAFDAKKVVPRSLFFAEGDQHE